MFGSRFSDISLKGDMFGGVTTAIISLPLALAFGVASGAGAEAGHDQDTPRPVQNRPQRGGRIDGTLIDFEEFSEGSAGPTVISQGTTFADPFSGFNPPGFDQFAIDDGTAIWDLNPAMTDYVNGNLLNINAERRAARAAATSV